MLSRVLQVVFSHYCLSFDDVSRLFGVHTVRGPGLVTEQVNENTDFSFNRYLPSAGTLWAGRSVGTALDPDFRSASRMAALGFAVADV